MSKKLYALSFPIAGLFLMHGYSYLVNPALHLKDQRETWILVQEFSVNHLGLPYLDLLAFYGEKLVILLGVFQILCGISIIQQNRLMIIYAALYWNITHIVLDNPVLMAESKYLYYEEFFPHLLNGFEYEGMYWDKVKLFLGNLIIVSILWFLGLSYDTKMAKDYVQVVDDKDKKD